MHKDTQLSLREALMRLVDFSQVKKPTVVQQEQADNDLQYVRGCYDTAFDYIVGKDVAKMKSTFVDGFSYYYDILNSDSTKPLTLPSLVSDAYLNEKAIPHTYEAHTTIMGVLETLEVYLTSWEAAYTRAKEFHRLLYLADCQWKADAAFSLAFDSGAYAVMVELSAIVKAFRLRKDRLEKSQMTIAQLVKLRTSTPTRQQTSYAGMSMQDVLEHHSVYK